MTALIHRTHSSCRKASENFAKPRSPSCARTSNNEANPPSVKNSVSHSFEQFASFAIKLEEFLSDGIRTNLINSSGSISFKFWRSAKSPSFWSLISRPTFSDTLRHVAIFDVIRVAKLWASALKLAYQDLKFSWNILKFAQSSFVSAVGFVVALRFFAFKSTECCW